jgi:hypothetical protein
MILSSNFLSCVRYLKAISDFFKCIVKNCWAYLLISRNFSFCCPCFSSFVSNFWYFLMSIQASLASILIASQKSTFSYSIINLIAFQPIQHQKHLKICLSGETTKEGVFSL